MSPPDLSVGAAIRAARNRDGISVRELGRRSGVAPSQISRLENGVVVNPEDQTIRAIASALVREPILLAFLAGRVPHTHLRGVIYDGVDQGDVELGGGPDDDEIEADPDLLRGPAFARFVEQSPVAVAQRLSTNDVARDLARIAAAWPAISPDRRNMLLALIEDNKYLAEQERMPKNPLSHHLSVDVQFDEDPGL